MLSLIILSFHSAEGGMDGVSESERWHGNGEGGVNRREREIEGNKKINKEVVRRSLKRNSKNIYSISIFLCLTY